MSRVIIDTSKIKDWDTFHNVFARAFGFPEFYGRNMNAWIDCMTSLDEPEAGMSNVHAPPGGVVVMELSDATDLALRQPELFEAIVDCAAFVNYRKLEVGENAVIALSYYR